MSDDTVTIPLSKPLDHNGTTIASLTFREATVGDMCLADLVQGDMRKMLAIMSGMANVPLPVLEQISTREFNAIIEKVRPLMGESEATTGQA